MSGTHISMPVRAVLNGFDEDELNDVLEFVLELELELELEFDDCADAAPASDRVITAARNAPATIRRAMDPLFRTLSLSPKRVCCRPEFVAGACDSCYSVPAQLQWSP